MRFFLDQLVGEWCDDVLIPAIVSSSLTQQSLSDLTILCRDFIHLTNDAGSLSGCNQRVLRGKVSLAAVQFNYYLCVCVTNPICYSEL